VILIEDVKIREVPGNRIEIFHDDGLSEAAPAVAEGRMPADKPAGRVEVVHGEAFIDPRTGGHIMVGIPRKIGEALRIPLDAFRGMSDHIHRLIQENSQQARQIRLLGASLRRGYDEFEAFASMGFWKRLLFLFKGRGMYTRPEAGDE
jgi:hypothetical protein